MKQVKTILIRLGLNLLHSASDKLDDAVNETIRKLDGEVVDIKYAAGTGFITAMIIYENKK